MVKIIGINILFDFSTYKVLIQLDENYQIDFAGSGNFHDLLGFDKKILKGSAFGESLPNITNSIDNIYSDEDPDSEDDPEWLPEKDLISADSETDSETEDCGTESE